MKKVLVVLLLLVIVLALIIVTLPKLTSKEICSYGEAIDKFAKG